VRQAVNICSVPDIIQELWIFRSVAPEQIIQQELSVKKIILITACVAAISGFTALGASAQTPSPAGKNSTSDNMSKDTMSKDGMKKDNMETTGTGMKKDSMNKDGMSKDSMSKETMSKDGMKKDGMSK
jgi:pentapeptide MXKDX repeat protein